MALRPARTICTAWLPVSAPSALDVVLGVEQLPEPARAHVGERVCDADRAAEAIDVGGGVRTLDALPAAGGERVGRTWPPGSRVLRTTPPS